MQTISELKELEITETPLLVFDCVLADGRIERWSTHRVTVGELVYEARILQHNVFEIQTASELGVDGIPRISVVLANADSHFSELERAGGFKGARLKVGFLFYDLRNGESTSETAIVFQGICNPPEEIREGTFRISATSRLNLQRLILPQVRIQRRCPWNFPETAAQREEARDGGPNGRYSRYYRCGYSAGLPGGSGMLNGVVPFERCGYTRADCLERGMFVNFGGIEFVPPTISVRTYGDKTWHNSAVAVNEARYNDFVPMVYGTAWYQPPVVFARNDGNLTRMEVLLGIGEIEGALKVLVNDVEIPLGVAGRNMTATGWYNVPTRGSRSGACNPDFADGAGRPAGDPYGSMAYLSVVVPNRLNDGTSLPRVRVLLQGLRVPVYGSDGTYAGDRFSSNPAWVVLDLLRRMGWAEEEIDLPSFAAAAGYCDEEIDGTDINGNALRLARFRVNFALQSRRSAGDLVRGVRNAARLLLTYGTEGRLELRVENSIAQERPTKPTWSNAEEAINGGWPSYEFGDGTNGLSGILRRPDGSSSVRLFSRSLAESPNRFGIEFQDELNEYQQDSFSLVDAEDVGRSGQEVGATLSAIGVANLDQAGRLLKLNLDKSVRGNTYIEFQTSVKAFGVRAGDLIAITYLKEGLNRQIFRVLKIAPGANHRITTLTAQIHDESWYDDSNGQTGAAGWRRQGSAALGTPRPLVGAVLDAFGNVQLAIDERTSPDADGSKTSLSVGFVTPASILSSRPGIPMVSLTTVETPGGSLEAGQIWYYALSGVDEEGAEGPLSFLVRGSVTRSGSSLVLQGLSFAEGTKSFHAYRGDTPAQLLRIASQQELSDRFIDSGLTPQLIGPIDPNFDHANFYWRMELQPEMQAAAQSATTLANPTLQMPPNRYRGGVARITRGRGAGQERAIAANDTTTVTVSPAWDPVPDATSYFVIAESGWKFGALSRTSPVSFDLPDHAGETAHILGRAANTNDVECAVELSPLTRFQLGSGELGTDKAPPPAPYFGIGLGRKGGTLELSGVSFAELTNTKTISSATLTLNYRDELEDVTQKLAGAISETDEQVRLSESGGGLSAGLIQVDQEILCIADGEGGLYEVTRGVHGTPAATHSEGTPVYRLRTKTAIAPFPKDFFGSPYSGSWSLPVTLPDARVASAELLVSNRFGNSETRIIRLTNSDDCGLRTLSGGQYSIQVGGCLAVDSAAAATLLIDQSHSIRDVYAVLGTPSDGPVELELRVNGRSYCTLTFAAGASVSAAVDGASLPPLRAGDSVVLAVTAVGQIQPGADLTVLIRL